MIYDPRSVIRLVYSSSFQQGIAFPISPSYQQSTPQIEMIIGAWYLDEFGNRTREIKARD